MANHLQPLFESFDRFLELNHNNLSCEQPVVLSFLKSFPDDVCALDGYKAVRSFLRSYEGNVATFNSYRTHVERILLWSLIVSKKPLLEMTRQDGERFMEFCLKPPTEWIGPIVKARFQRVGRRKASDTDTFSINPAWRPFFYTNTKRTIKVAKEQDKEIEATPYAMSQDTVAQIFAVCGSFFQFATDEGLTSKANPIRAIKQKSKYKQRSASHMKAKALSYDQWDFVLATAKKMADEDPENHERTLFIIATIFSMYLRVSDIVGRDNWEPMMRDFQRDSSGNWWFYVIGKGNKAAKISVKDEYMSTWMARYRRFLGMTSAPSPDDQAPLVTSLKGRPGLSEGHIRKLVQTVFDKAFEQMRKEGKSEEKIDSLRSASLHWLRHTSATFDAKVRDMKDLQDDLRHESLATTTDTYYNSLDDERHRSNKKLSIEGRRSEEKE